MNEISTYDFNGQGVRLIEKEDNPWFVASDVAKILGYSHTPHMIRGLDDDEADVHNVDIRSANGTTQKRTITIISESGLYSCILRSQRQEAKAFRKWVTSEVLPSIRKTGSYHIEQQRAQKLREHEMLLDYYEADRRYWHEKARRIHAHKPVSNQEIDNMVILDKLGYSTAYIAQYLSRSRSTVRRWMRAYRQVLADEARQKEAAV